MPRKLVFYANRSTPQVVPAGERPKPKKGYGTVTRTRAATPGEEQALDKGKWLRVDTRGNTPKSKDYKLTGYRPTLAERRRAKLEGE